MVSCLYVLEDINFYKCNKANLTFILPYCIVIVSIFNENKCEGYYKEVSKKLDGAVPPFCIHADSSAKTFLEDGKINGQNKEVYVDLEFTNGLAPLNVDSYVGDKYDAIKWNPFDFCVHHNTSGSMTQESFWIGVFIL